MSDLGAARGRILIDTSDVQRAQREVAQASRGMSQALNALGIGLGARELVQYAVEADRVATAFRRQSVAARNLAGGQAQLNELLATYNDATGGAVSNAQALADVTRLLAIGFADSAAELDQFARAARGIAIATGQSQDYIIGQLQLAIANQSTMRLDQLGLGVSEVKQRIDELKASNKSMTDEMAYQQAILELAEEKFGEIADSAAGAATGMEQLRKEWDNLMLSLGGGPIDFVAQAMANWLKDAQRDIGYVIKAVEELEKAWDRLRFAAGVTNINPDLNSGISDRARGNAAGLVRPQEVPRWGENQRAVESALVEWSQQVRAIERQAAQDRLDATRQYEEQRTSAIRQYEQSIAREAEDFARNRAREAQDYAISLQRMHRDIAQREARQLADLERTISDARTDAAERANDRQIALDERIAETRSQANERIAELESDFAKRQERSQRTFARQLRDAAANLDAVRVRELQQERRERLQEEQDNFAERLDKERQNEAKRLADLEKAHAKQTASEAKALQKRIDDANDAYQRQLTDARAADEQRLADMAADRALRLERENEDRATRLERMAEDHAAQLEEMARQHELRLIQIAEQEQDERDLLDEEFQKELDALGIRTDKWTEKQKQITDYAIAEFDRWWERITQIANGLAGIGPQPLNPMITPGGWPSLGTSSVVPSSVNNSRAVSITAPIQVFAATGQSPHDIAGAVRREIADLLEEIAN